MVKIWKVNDYMICVVMRYLVSLQDARCNTKDKNNKGYKFG